MKVLVQRVKRASVEAEQKIAGEIGQGLLLFVGVQKGDTAVQAEYLPRRRRICVFLKTAPVK